MPLKPGCSAREWKFVLLGCWCFNKFSVLHQSSTSSRLRQLYEYLNGCLFAWCHHIAHPYIPRMCTLRVHATCMCTMHIHPHTGKCTQSLATWRRFRHPLPRATSVRHRLAKRILVYTEHSRCKLHFIISTCRLFLQVSNILCQHYRFSSTMTGR